jgi:hypothetical protein
VAAVEQGTDISSRLRRDHVADRPASVAYARL